MREALNHIADIRTGLFAKTTSKGEIVYLQAKHFNEQGQLSSILYPDLIADKTIEKHLLVPGDILFAAKGSKNFAALYEAENQQAVASTTFFVIRLRRNDLNRILPEYLVWFLNHPNTQKNLKERAIGTAIVSISKAVLEKLEISIPDIQTQRAVLKITLLLNKEKKLKQKIETLKEEQIQQQLLNVLK